MMRGALHSQKSFNYIRQNGYDELSSESESSPPNIPPPGAAADEDSGSGVGSFAGAAPPVSPLAAGPELAANAPGFSNICFTVSSPSHEYVSRVSPSASASLYARSRVCGTPTIVG